ncbi:MAG: sulfate adenylyltransferase [Planctomycetota bacterium]|nr:MAG: sulfate adenylyltransferase [Planctomycetota bacterium]
MPTASGLINPHGGALVDRLAPGDEARAIRDRAGSLAAIDLSAKQSCDLEMIGVGAFSPLTGFMGQADCRSVCDSMTLASGEVWPIPILLAVDSARAPAVGEEVALYATAPSTGQRVLQGIMRVQEVFPHDKAREIPAVFRTEDPAHPGVKQVLDEGDTCLAGPVTVVQPCVDPDGPEAFLDHRMAPAQTRALFAERGWRTVAAFQTRNPIHRAHEYLCKCAQEICDGLLIHPLVGETKPGDIPAATRMACYRVLIDKYFVPERTALTVMPAAMRYAGPREAVLHALVRKNYGCTHFIVGRDHAGVGDYYGTYDAQNIFDELDPASVGITPLKFEHAAWCQTCEGMTSAKTCPHPGDQKIFLSGTKVREMLAAGRKPPMEFSRPEVAEELIGWAAGG